MKVFVVLSCVALAFAIPVSREGGPMEMPDEPPKDLSPLTFAEMDGLMQNVKEFAGEARGHFERLRDDADAIDGSDQSLSDLGEKTMNMIGELDGLSEGAERLGHRAEKAFMRLVFAGVEDEGQCHHVLIHLIKLSQEMHDGKRQMSEEERQFWMSVVGEAKKEVRCIVNRFHEYEGIIQHVQDFMNNPPADYNEEGHALEAEMLMGGLYFGFGHLYRQVAVFAHTMHALLTYDEQAGSGSRALEQLRSVLHQAEQLQARMDSMEKMKRLGARGNY